PCLCRSSCSPSQAHRLCLCSCSWSEILNGAKARKRLIRRRM
ncbi:unnamed protein product, partial [Brassica oleracea var. botrytis]